MLLALEEGESLPVGEIRDRATAEAAMQASLTGHLLLSTFHAGSAVETLGRLLDMGIEPYVVRSGLLAVLCQRLLRRLCSVPGRSTTRKITWACRSSAPRGPSVVRNAVGPAIAGGSCLWKCWH